MEATPTTLYLTSPHFTPNSILKPHKHTDGKQGEEVKQEAAYSIQKINQRPWFKAMVGSSAATHQRDFMAIFNSNV